MIFFSKYLIILLGFLVFFLLLTPFYLRIKEKREKTRAYELYYLFLGILIYIFSFLETVIYPLSDNSPFLLIIELEMVFILFLFNILYYFSQQNAQDEWTTILYLSIIILLSHIVICGIYLSFLVGTIISLFIALLSFTIIIPYNKDWKLRGNLIIFSLLIYYSLIENILFISIISFCITITLVSLVHDEIRLRIVAVYPGLIIILKRIIFRPKILMNKFSIISDIEKPKNLNTNKKVKFFQVKVKIIQRKLEQEQDPLNLYQLNERSFLIDLLPVKATYVLEIISHKKFSLSFITKHRNKEKAHEQGLTILTKLKSLYEGIDGEISVIKISSKEIYKKDRYWEIKIPKPPFIEKMTFIRDIINLFDLNEEKIEIYIMWKRVSSLNQFRIKKIREDVRNIKFNDADEKENFLEMWQGDLYKLRIFFTFKVFEKDVRLRNQKIREIEAMLKTLAMSSRNETKIAKIKKASPFANANIISNRLYGGRYITSKSLDFDVLHGIPLPRSYALEDENIINLDVEDHDLNYILIGNYIRNGRVSEKKIPIHKNIFSQSVLIGGQPGSGKTYLLSQITKEFYTKCPDIGIMIINLGKGNQELLYKFDKIYKYGKSNLRVPYFIRGKFPRRSLQETAKYLVAAVGLKNIVEINMFNVMQLFEQKRGQPKTAKVLFNNLLKYFEFRPYHSKFQTNIIRAIENRVLSMLSDMRLEKTLELYNNPYKMPSWFEEWRKGKKVYIDLSSCTIYEKRLLCNAIFQIVRSCVPDKEEGNLKNIILLDEAHQILEKPSLPADPDDDDYISRQSLKDIFNELLREFRSKGVSFIISDQTPYTLFDCATILPSLKFLFRLGHLSASIMGSNEKEEALLPEQENRHFIVVNGVTGEKYRGKTLDLPIPTRLYNKRKQFEREYENTNKFCQFCHQIIDIDAVFCHRCGSKLIYDTFINSNSKL